MDPAEIDTVSLTTYSKPPLRDGGFFMHMGAQFGQALQTVREEVPASRHFHNK
jgi:hypothetical protein